MTDLNQWQQNNSRQLGDALAALRQRLEDYIRRQSSSAPKSKPAPASAPAPAPVSRSVINVSPASQPSATKTVSRTLIQRLIGNPADKAEKTPTPLSPSEEPVAAAAEPPVIQAKAEIAEPPSALALLSQRLDLSLFEQNVLLLCASMELDTRIANLCARAQDDPPKPFPTFALALDLFDEPAWDVLSPERPLRYFRLIEIHQPGAQPLTTSPLRADERIVSYLKGLNYPDDRLTSFLVPMDLDLAAESLAPSQSAVVDMILSRLNQSSSSLPLSPVQLLGADAISKHLVAQQVAARLGRRLYRLPVELLPAASADVEMLARLWQRESLLLPLALYLDSQELDGGAPPERFGPLNRFLTRSNGVFFIGTRELMPRLTGRDSIVLDVAKPTSSEQQQAWSAVLGSSAGESPSLLAAQFNLNFPVLQQFAAIAKAATAGSSNSLAEVLWDTCCASERPRLDALAQRLEPKATWNDFVLPAAEMNLLRQISTQVRQRSRVYDELGFARKMNRGFGISALFAGDSGTGKTMAAEVIANDLRLNLYRIDLSAVVSKYIGETEKNLRRLFDAAEDGGAMLFFDEADALFGKRSEVKDSHDRYANIEINYLLQRIESFRGLAILATNMKGALDSAFTRRLRFIVNFPFPTPASRRQLWQKVFPQRDPKSNVPFTQVAELDYDRLARLNLAGGHIHNVALNAAFLAATEWEKKQKSGAASGAPIVTMPLILEAACAEFLKLDRPINAADFRWVEPVATEVMSGTKTGEPVLQ
jgi:hypothetical protein